MDKYIITHKRKISIRFIYVIITLMLSSIFLPLFGTITFNSILTTRYAFIVFVAIFNIIILATNIVVKIQIDNIFISILIFLSYLLIISMLTCHYLGNVTLLMIISFAVLLFSFKMIPNTLSTQINTIILFVCFLETCYGLILYFIINTEIEVPILGTFDNPAGFAACLSSCFPFCLYFSQRSKSMKIVRFILIAIIIISIVLSQSRSGIIAIILVSLLYTAHKYYTKIRRNCSIISAVTAVLIVISIILFFSKKNSSVGRLFIWKRTIEMVADNPIFGSGSDSFIVNYMPYQADYFKNNINPDQAILADNITHPFSEYLLLTAEFGIIGLILLTVPMYFIIRYFSHLTPYHLCIFSIGIFSIFSYPLRYPFVLIILSYCLAKIYCKNRITINSKILLKGIFAILSSLLIALFIKHFSFEVQWKNSLINIQADNNTQHRKQILSKYEELYSDWNGNPIFLYNYGAILHEEQKYEESNTMMIESIKYFNNYDAHLIIGMNYELLHQYTKAEDHYYIAKYMCPNRFIPLYRLMHLYVETDSDVRAKQIAYEIIDKTVKVESLEVSSIKQSAKNLLKTQ